MFVLVEMVDTVRISPWDFHKRLNDAIAQELNKKLANKVVYNVGLCICLYDVTKLDDSFIFPGDGASHTKVNFRYVVFHPFLDEVLVGKIKYCSHEGVHVTMGFFDDILIPPESLQQPAKFDEAEQVWLWEYETDEGAHDLYMDQGEEIRFRVTDEVFVDTSPTGPATATEDTAAQPGQSTAPPPEAAVEKKEAPYTLIGTISEPGLGDLKTGYRIHRSPPSSCPGQCVSRPYDNPLIVLLPSSACGSFFQSELLTPQGNSPDLVFGVLLWGRQSSRLQARTTLDMAGSTSPSESPLRSPSASLTLSFPFLRERSRVWKDGTEEPLPRNLPSPLPTKRTRTYSATVRAHSGAVFKGVCKNFSRCQGHGFIQPSHGGEDIFVHISDVEGEYVPVEGDEVTYKVCRVPPKNLKVQAVEVKITHLNPGSKHETWSGQIITS
uniref:DNA-directed RNA polymerase III subunit RPC8 n=1 Tax=Knipowitschia caucasica TaxID=637954 RepID=A0AAV2KL71_KNICA